MTVAAVMARGPDGRLAGSLAGYEALQYRGALNAAGGWQLTIRSDHPAAESVSVPGSGIVVYDDTGAVDYSGPVLPSMSAAAHTHRITAQDARLVISGVSDLTCLLWRVIVPPARKTHETVTGLFGRAAAELVSRQIRLPAWATSPTDIGEHVSLSGRWTNLGETILGEATRQGLHAAATWSDGQIMFTVAEIHPTAVPISVEAGSAVAITQSFTPDTFSYVVALGQGEGTARTVRAADHTGGDLWRRIEHVIDRRDLDSAAGVAVAAEAALITGGESVAVELTPGVPAPKVGQSAYVSVDGEQRVLAVAESTTFVTPEAERTVITLGAPARSAVTKLAPPAATPIHD